MDRSIIHQTVSQSSSNTIYSAETSEVRLTSLRYGRPSYRNHVHPTAPDLPPFSLYQQFSNNTRQRQKCCLSPRCAVLTSCIIVVSITIAAFGLGIAFGIRNARATTDVTQPTTIRFEISGIY